MSTSPKRRRNGGRRVVAPLLCALAVIAASLLSACGDDLFGPQIIDLQVTPNTLSQSDVSTTAHDVSIVVSGFEGRIVDADAFIEDNGEEAAKDDFEITGNTIALVGVNPGWFQDLPEGSYSIGATVVSDAGEEVTQLDLETVTITAN